MLPGWMGDRRDWDEVGVEGAIDLPAAEDMGAAADAVLAAAPERFGLAGYSMGGRLAIEIACKAPGRVAALVLVSTTAGIEDDVARAARQQRDDERAAAYEEDPQAFVDRWYTAPLWGQLPARPGFRAMRARRGDRGHGATLRALSVGRWAPRWADLPALTMPTVWLAGASDDKYTAIATRGAAVMPAGRAEIVPDAAHALLVEAPEVVAGAIRALEK